ncbi:MAG: hypothetical protein JSU83_06880, partial [Deltaproteobacteria bacterium]
PFLKAFDIDVYTNFICIKKSIKILTGWLPCKPHLFFKGSHNNCQNAVPIATAVAPARAKGNFLPTRCRIIAPWAPKRQLPSILLPAGTTLGVPQKDTAAFA